jgi:prevent-host-death family protein
VTRRREIGIRELKSSTSKIVNEVRETEGEYVVTKHGRPVAVLRAVRKGELEEGRAARIESVIDRLQRTARAVAAAAGEESAAAAVSRQRR